MRILIIFVMFSKSFVVTTSLFDYICNLTIIISDNFIFRNWFFRNRFSIIRCCKIHWKIIKIALTGHIQTIDFDFYFWNRFRNIYYNFWCLPVIYDIVIKICFTYRFIARCTVNSYRIISIIFIWIISVILKR